MHELVGAVLLELRVEHAAVADDDGADAGLLCEEGVRLFVLFGVFISEVLKQNCLLLSCDRIEVLKWPVICALELLEGPPLVRGILTHEDLACVGLAAQVDLLGVDLVRDIDEEHVEEVIGGVVWLEDDLDLVRLVCRDRSLLRDHHKWNLLAVILHAVHLGLEAEVYRERRNVLDLERLLGGLADKHVAERQDAVFRRDLDLGPDTGTFEQDRDHGVVREHHDALFLDLLEQRLELHHDWLGLSGFDCSHGIEN